MAKKRSSSTKKPSRSKPQAPKKINWKLHEPADTTDAIMAVVKPLRESEDVALVDAVDRTLAENIRAPITLPVADASERDGYALRASDLATQKLPAELDQIGEATAGKPFAGKVGRGQCARIATGAVIPQGADAVVMFEDAAAGAEGKIRFIQAAKKWQWVARAGGDLKEGRVMLRKGDALTPGQIACASACGLTSLPVLRRPRALVFTTGDEVRQPGEKLRPGDVYDGNTFSIASLLRQQFIKAETCATVRDTEAALKRKLLQASKKYDLIVFTGGTSVGDKDFGRRALDAVGKTVVHGVNLKPGKPLLFGTIGKCLVFGLPGFPTSALMLAYKFLLPAALRLAGYSDVVEPWVEGVLAHDFARDAHKLFMVPVKLGDDGMLTSAFRGSAAISSISEAGGYVEIDPGKKPLRAGTPVAVRLM